MSSSGERVPSLTSGDVLVGGWPRFFDGGAASSTGEQVVSLEGGADLGGWRCFFSGLETFFESFDGGMNFERSATA